MYKAAPQASMGPTPGGNDYSSFVPDITSFGDFLPSSVSGLPVTSSSHEAFARQNAHTNCFGNQPPPNVQSGTVDTARQCLHCGGHKAQMEAIVHKLHTLVSHLERVELAMYQMQIQMQGTTTKQDVQLSSIAQKMDTKNMELAGSIAQLKRGMERFFTRFAEQFSDSGEGASTDDDASMLRHMRLPESEQSVSPATLL